MTTAVEKQDYKIDPGEKVTSVMAYTNDHLVWGDFLTKEAIHVSIWLRTPGIPIHILLRDAYVVMFGGSATPKPLRYPELFLPTSQIIGFHIRPPARDPLDYDPTEPNRKMEPVTALVGWFRFNGLIRMVTQTTVERYLEVARETFIPLYDVEVSQPSFPTMSSIRIPFALVRSEKLILAPSTK